MYIILFICFIINNWIEKVGVSIDVQYFFCVECKFKKSMEEVIVIFSSSSSSPPLMALQSEIQPHVIDNLIIHILIQQMSVTLEREKMF